MRRRQPRTLETPLPARLAAGPVRDDYRSVTAWRGEVVEWAREHGHVHWQSLLPEPVRLRYAPTARERFRQLPPEGAT